MNEGISVEEACAGNVIGTREDFERNCNPDGTVKQHADTTTFSLKGTDTSITIDNTYLWIGGTTLAIMALILVVVVIKKQTQKAK